MILYYVTIGLCIITYRTMDITYMRITKYDICLVWILPQYKFAVLRYYIISFPIHFTFQYTYISQFFFWRLWCRYMRFLRCQYWCRCRLWCWHRLWWCWHRSRLWRGLYWKWLLYRCWYRQWHSRLSGHKIICGILK